MDFHCNILPSVRVVALDLDGTLSQHKQHLPEENKRALVSLGKKYKLLMAGAGAAARIFRQMEGFPVDIIGNYGMQYARYDGQTQSLRVVRDVSVPCDRVAVEKIVAAFREKYGFEQFAGESVEYHESGCITFPILGTAARLEEKLAFDPDRTRRRAIYREVVGAFSAYNVFVGGSSSFDMAPKPYDKAYALDLFCRENGLSHENVVYIGDDYGTGGNDESVYRSDFPYLTIDDFREFPRVCATLL